MRSTICKSLSVSLLVLGFGVSASAQNLIRKSAEFRNFDFSESSTTAVATGATTATAGGGGASIYTKVIAADVGENILYITISAIGDTHGGAASWFACSVDGVACNSGKGGADAAPFGWISLNKLPAATTSSNCNDGGGGTGDCHDNSVTYQWCAVIPAASVLVGGPHTAMPYSFLGWVCIRNI